MMRLNKRAGVRLIVSLIFIFSVLILWGQDDYESWKQQQQQAWREYKDAQDKAFVEFLEKEWTNFQTFKGEVADRTPKPVKIPVAEETAQPEKLLDTPVVKDVPILQVEEAEIKETRVYAEPLATEQITVRFWGYPLQFDYMKSLDVAIAAPVNEKAVADFWYVVSNTEYEKLQQQLKQYRQELNLNDWGYCVLLNEIGMAITDGSPNLSRLFVWFMLSKSGYECKVGFNENDIYLLLPCANVIYGVPYLVFDEKRFYLMTFDDRKTKLISINTYEGRYPDADALMDLNIKETPRIKGALIEKELKFVYAGEEYTIPVKYNQEAAKFFREYPHTNLEVYFNAPLSEEAGYSLSKGLKPILEGRTEADAVNVLLRFVQTAFKYKTDDEQFGREKSLFSDETLFYPYSDCEDRSIIFSFLVRNLLGLTVIGLDYPGHISTGVNFHIDLPGDIVTYNNDTYLICDPTYINADIGMVMPQFKNVKPRIISLK